MSETSVVLSIQPLPADQRAAIDAALGHPATFEELSRLRKLGTRQTLRAIRSWRGRRLVLALADEGDQALRPVLEFVGALSGAKPIAFFEGERLVDQARRKAFTNGLRLVPASIRSLVAVRSSERELTALMADDRIVAPLASDRSVLYLNGNLWFGVKAGGSVGHIAGVVNGLADRGRQVEVAALTEPTLVGPRVPFHRLRTASALGLPAEYNAYRFHKLICSQLSPIVNGGRYGFIYQRMSFGNYSGVVLSRAQSLPLVLEFNGSEVWVAQNWGTGLRRPAVAELAERVNLRHAHLVVTVSQVLGDQLVDTYGVPAERVVVYPNCVDPTRFDPEVLAGAAAERRAVHQVAPDAVVVTFVGTFGKWHGAEVLAGAIVRLREQHAEWLAARKVHFVLVGDGLGMEAVRGLIGGPEFAPCVTLTGLVPQDLAPAYLAASDILVSPHVENDDGSRFFGSPTKLFEYMAIGRAILASDLDQIGHVLQGGIRAETPPTGSPRGVNGELAMLTRPGDVNALADGIRFLVDHPDWRERLGQNARREALARYTWEHHVSAIIDRLESLAARPGGL